MDGTASADDGVPWIAHDEFRAGLAAGRMRVVVDPVQAQPWVARRTRIDFVALAFIGSGAALALTGTPWGGAALVALGIVARRLVRRHAPRIALHLALNDAGTYAEVTANGVMEVRRAAGA